MHIRTVIAPSVVAALLCACTHGADLHGDMSAKGAVARGRDVYVKECAQCHGAEGEGGGPASLGLGVAPPELVGLSAGNGGRFPRAYVRQYVLGLPEDKESAGPMPYFARVGLRHVHPTVGADGDV